MLKTVSIQKNYVKELCALAMPMIMGNLGIILIGAGSVFVAAKHSTDTLAAISIANSIIACIFMFGIGLLASVSPLLSNYRGRKEGAKKYLLPTIAFALILAFFSMIIILLSVSLIEKIGFEPKLMPVIKQFMIISAFSTFGGYLHAALKEYLQAFEIVFFPNFIAVISVFLNILLSFVLVFGWFGLPALGAVGIAIACLLTRTFEGLCLLIFCLSFIRIQKFNDFRYYQNLIKIGFPIAMAILFEFLAFNIVTIIMGKVSGVYAAGHNILLTITTATFMIPVSISTAIAVKVGFANGAKNIVDLKGYSLAGTLISVGFMSFCAAGFIFFPNFFINIFTNDPTLVKICVPIMLLAGIFQVFDGLQVSLSGIFKGIKQTNTVMIGDLFAYWVIGLPLGFLLAFHYKMNLYGFWIGLTLSIFSLSMILLLILMRHFKTLKFTE
jgi:MATE family multidrug resistance protein